MAWFSNTSSDPATTISGSSALGTALTDLLMAPDIQPGSEPSYQLCKILYSTHPLGKKIVDAPITMAQSQEREITIPAAPEERVRAAFLEARKAMSADYKLAGNARLARVYGMSVLAVVQKDVAPSEPLDLKNLYKQDFTINVLDPLNTAGSLSVFNQDPNSPSFQNVPQVRVAGRDYHPSRTFVLTNETPIYIEYTSSSFGFTGRSVYQRALFPLKTFVQAMRTDDLVVRKAGVIVAMIKQVGSMVDNVMAKITQQKRVLAREAITDDVLSVGSEDKIESMNLQNLEGPYALARKNAIDNMAAAADMPSIVLNSETYAEGFGEGTEDAKKVASFVDNFRLWMNPAYEFLDTIAMYKAWNPNFYAGIQGEFPEEYGGVDFNQAFYAWRNSFKAAWPSLITEPPSEKCQVAKVKFESAVALAEVLLPKLGPVNQAKVLTWLADGANEQKDLFPVALVLDPDELEEFVAQQAEAQAQLRDAGVAAAQDGDNENEEPGPPRRPFADSAVARLADRRVVK